MFDKNSDKAPETDADFVAFLDAHYDRIFAYAWRILGNREDAEDLTQDICLSLPHKLEGFRGGCAVSTWLYRIVSNGAIDLMRKRSTLTKNAQSWADSLSDAEQDGRERRVRQEWLQTAMLSLPEDLRVTAALLVEEGMTQARAAEILDCAPGTVAWRMSEIKVHLAKLAEEHGYE